MEPIELYIDEQRVEFFKRVWEYPRVYFNFIQWPVEERDLRVDSNSIWERTDSMCG